MPRVLEADPTPVVLERYVKGAFMPIRIAMGVSLSDHEESKVKRNPIFVGNLQ